MCHPTCDDINSPRRVWIEIDSQILNALFCVTGFGLGGAVGEDVESVEGAEGVEGLEAREEETTYTKGSWGGWVAVKIGGVMRAYVRLTHVGGYP
ncbi:hypothetical protein V498_03727 [Pseudogymnoascus sp. VKM F-4517 (FW-2822)]|nr:hypothetical protein V498_03727 [Pseudogymnoascus sp. VKM F-4517 (FW-2822)]